MTTGEHNDARDGDPLGIIGTVVAEKYQVLALAGEGGFSLVYQARHLIWQQLVAMKFFVILEEAEQALRERLLEDFIREGKLMSELSSRSAAIVQARDIGKLQTATAWIPYMVLEWLDGTPLDVVLLQDLKERLRPRSLVESMQLLEPVAAALDLAHRRNVAHRDLKPANIMVIGADPRQPQGCKLLDFGIAKVMGEKIEHEKQLQMTGQQITAFTPNYGAPEQFSRQFGATGPWTDVFAMALIIVELLRGGVRALEGETFFELGVSSSNPIRPTPGHFGIPISAELEAVFAKALAIHPAARYGTMGEFWIDLHRIAFPAADMWQMRPPTSSEPYQAGSLRGGYSSPFSGGSLIMPSSVPAMLAPPSMGGAQSGVQQPIGVTSPSPSIAPRPTVTGIPVLSAPTERALTVTGTVSGPRAPARSSGALALGGVALVAVLGIGGVMLWKRGDSTAPAPSPSASLTASATATASSSAEPVVEWDGPCPKGMKAVNGGSFAMGSDDPSFPLWKPAHKVTIDTYCLDVHEVTVTRYGECVAARGCKPADSRPNFPKDKGDTDEEHAKQLDITAELCNWDRKGKGDHPINCVDWYRADAYCKWRKFRLPTEAEWELAARGTDGRKFPWGDDTGDHTYMNAAGVEWKRWREEKGLPPTSRLMYEKDDGFVGTAPVGRFPRAQTQSGQLDMVGNVWEWTSDWYALYSADEQVNPKGPAAGERKAIRGGGYNGEFATWVNPAARFHQLATASVDAIGFRCAANIKPAQ
jgi:formylglycine-generating enzyme required for sulfatase activity/serine/threonine protein kinase